MNTVNENLKAFLDESGRVKRWPKKSADKKNVLQYLQAKFNEGRTYSEAEVNTVLQMWHTFNDHALLRREMYNNFLLDRTPDCREYRITKQPDNTL